ncbi:MAG: hypothetical protein BWX86_02865 [Verrucomicrobia bacterium ADurb.Bin122]|nr:MAG: hypothetical protein BWX86_02865 [Verrucomicrobia bacterium ADurb.Bin122]
MFVEVARRLVGEDQLRPVHQGARHGDALALAAGELAWQVVPALGEADAGEQFVGSGAGFGIGAPADAAGHEYIGARIELGDQVKRLKHHAEVRGAAVGAGIGRAGPADFAGIRFVETGEQVEQGGFARAGLAADAHAFAGGDGEIHAAQHLDLAVAAEEGFAHVVRAEDGGMVGHDYSLRSASTGLSRAARQAGSSPASVEMTTEHSTMAQTSPAEV